MTQVIKNRVYLLYKNCVDKFIANYVPSQKQAETNPRSSHSNTQYFETDPQQFKKWTLVLKTMEKAMFFSHWFYHFYYEKTILDLTQAKI